MTTRSGRAWPYLVPFGLGVVLLLLLPMLLNAGYAFTDHTGLGDPTFNGLANVRRSFDDPLLAASLRTSLIHAVLAVPLRLVAAVGLGLLLASPRRATGWYRAAVFTPTVLPDLALALAFLWIFNPVAGPLNGLLGALGLPQPLWLGTPWGARWAIVLMLVFPIGEAFLVVLAARRTLDPALYDAAAVDGAGPWQQLRLLTLPQLAPLLVLLAVRDTILTLQVNVVPGYVLTDGGPGTATLYLPLYIFDQAFEFLGFGYAAWLTLLLLTITTVLIAAQAVYARRRGWI